MKAIVKLKIFIMFFMVSLGLVANAFSEDIRFQVEVDRNAVRLGEAVQLTLKVSGKQDIAPIKLPDIDGFEVNYAGGPYKQFSWVNGKSTSSISYNYSLFPTKTGKFVIPALTLTIDGNNYTSDSIVINVSNQPVSAAQPPGSSASSSGSASIEDKMILRLDVPRTEVYLNEVFPVRVLLLVSGLKVEYGEAPEFSSPGISLDSVGDSKQGETVINGVRYNVVEFDLNMSASRLGEVTLGPARLGCNIIMPGKKDSFFGHDSFFGNSMFDSMFDTSERVPRTLQSNEVPLKVLPVPEEGKPKDFSGGVGQFTFEAQIGPASVKVGDPITLKMKIAGAGNLDAVQFPSFPEDEKFKTYEPILNAEAGIRTREQVIIPKTDSLIEVPAVEFSYFDTKDQKYKTITRGPFPIQVAKMEPGEELKVVGLDSVAKPATPEVLGQDIVFIKDSIGNVSTKGQGQNKGIFLSVILFLFFLGWLFFLVDHKRTHKLKTDIVYAKKMHAPIYARKGLKQALELMNRNESQKFYDVVFKTFQDYLANKLHLPKGSIAFDVVKQAVGPKIPDAKIMEEIRVLFDECDRVRYSSAKINQEDLQKSYRRLQQVIDFMEIHIK